MYVCVRFSFSSFFFFYSSPSSSWPYTIHCCTHIFYLFYSLSALLLLLIFIVVVAHRFFLVLPLCAVGKHRIWHGMVYAHHIKCLYTKPCIHRDTRCGGAFLSLSLSRSFSLSLVSRSLCLPHVCGIFGVVVYPISPWVH